MNITKLSCAFVTDQHGSLPSMCLIIEKQFFSPESIHVYSWDKQLWASLRRPRQRRRVLWTVLKATWPREQLPPYHTSTFFFFFTNDVEWRVYHFFTLFSCFSVVACRILDTWDIFWLHHSFVLSAPPPIVFEAPTSQAGPFPFLLFALFWCCLQGYDHTTRSSASEGCRCEPTQKQIDDYQVCTYVKVIGLD